MLFECCVYRSARSGAATHIRKGSAPPPRRMPASQPNHWQGTSVYIVLFFGFNKTFLFYILHFFILPHYISLF